MARKMKGGRSTLLYDCVRQTSNLILSRKQNLNTRTHHRVANRDNERSSRRSLLLKMLVGSVCAVLGAVAWATACGVVTIIVLKAWWPSSWLAPRSFLAFFRKP